MWHQMFFMSLEDQQKLHYLYLNYNQFLHTKEEVQLISETI